MRSLVLVLLPLLTTAAVAAPLPPSPEADVDGALLLGGGLRLATGDDDRMLDGTAFALDVTAGIHMSPAVSIGVHAAVSKHAYHDDFNGSIFDRTTDASIVPVDLGLALQFEHGRFAVTPWAGRRMTHRSDSVFTCDARDPMCTRDGGGGWTNDAWSFGATASVDALNNGENHLSAFLGLQGAGDYQSITLGMAYRR